MTLEEARAKTEGLMERFNAPFSSSDKAEIERLYTDVLGKRFRPTSCQQCYHDALIEINLYLRKRNIMAKDKNYALRSGFIINSPVFENGKIFTNDNLTDEIAERYLEMFPQMRTMFARVPEKPVSVPSDALKDDGVVSYKGKQGKRSRSKNKTK